MSGNDIRVLEADEIEIVSGGSSAQDTANRNAAAANAANRNRDYVPFLNPFE